MKFSLSKCLWCLPPHLRTLACVDGEVELNAAGPATQRSVLDALGTRYPILRDVIGRSHKLFLPLGATFNKSAPQWAFASGAIVEFGFLDADEDKYRNR